MQTFLPYKDFKASAECLDMKRLGKQRVEAYQILKILMGLGKVNKNGKVAWENHPAVRMWRGYEYFLKDYIAAICAEWVYRGYKDTIAQKTSDLFRNTTIAMKVKPPEWLGNDKFHASHRSNLLRKDKRYYGGYGWLESNDLPYVWPV